MNAAAADFRADDDFGAIMYPPRILAIESI